MELVKQRVNDSNYPSKERYIMLFQGGFLKLSGQFNDLNFSGLIIIVLFALTELEKKSFISLKPKKFLQTKLY